MVFSFLLLLHFSLPAQVQVRPPQPQKIPDTIPRTNPEKILLEEYKEPPPQKPTRDRPVKIIGIPPQPVPTASLYGYVDMHTHPAAQLGFGEQLFFGGNDGDPNLALGSCNCVHNFVTPPFSGSCGQQNLYRNTMVDKIDQENNLPVHSKIAGFPTFSEWPKYNSLLHQQMWIDWIRRARDGGLRVMVALAVNNHCIADATETGGANDDLTSMNKQLNEMKALFSRHTDFAEIAYSAADLRRIVKAGNLAVILGIEMDNIGNFYTPADPKGASYNPSPTDAQIRAEIDRLYNLGVRYIFPVHITNNLFGGAAIYVNSFNVANKYNTGAAFVPEDVNSSEGITFVLSNPFAPIRQNVLAGFAMAFTGSVLPGHIMPDNPANYPTYLPPRPGNGHRNSQGLSARGDMAVRYMMQKGMLIDIDHMSEKSANTVLDMATLYNYPVNSGHNGFRGPGANSRGLGINNENARTEDQVRKIYNLGGMMGLGHGGHSTTFVNSYRYGLTLTNNQPLAIGTDVNGFFPLPAPPMQLPNGPFNPQESITYGPSLTKCTTGGKTWDFNVDGMAHYGLLPDYIESCRKVGMTAAEENAFFSSAERFAQMWERCEASSKNIR